MEARGLHARGGPAGGGLPPHAMPVCPREGRPRGERGRASRVVLELHSTTPSLSSRPRATGTRGARARRTGTAHGGLGGHVTTRTTSLLEGDWLRDDGDWRQGLTDRQLHVEHLTFIDVGRHGGSVRAPLVLDLNGLTRAAASWASDTHLDIGSDHGCHVSHLEAFHCGILRRETLGCRADVVHGRPGAGRRRRQLGQTDEHLVKPYAAALFDQVVDEGGGNDEDGEGGQDLPAVKRRPSRPVFAAEASPRVVVQHREMEAVKCKGPVTQPAERRPAKDSGRERARRLREREQP
eukprot:scaffold131153_cov66-Phaeocystis_antarctica.AAC.3